MEWKEKLEDLERWVGTEQSDGYVAFTFTENGMITLMCGKELPIPPVDLGSSKEFNTKGWVGEVVVGWSGEQSEIRLKAGDHIWVYALSLEQAVDRLHEYVILCKRCSCRTRAEENA